MKRTMVTGGAGFLGSHLCEALLRRGDSVLCLDNLSTGNHHNIEHLLVNSQFQFIKQDVIEPFAERAIAPLWGAFDQIFNLACPASPPAYQADPIHTMETSFLGVLHVLELARETGAQVLQASTSEVYGDPEVHPQAESYRGCVNTFGPRACYDEGKRAAETLCYDFARSEGVDVRVVRIFNTYGPRLGASDGRVVSNFINQALNEQPITIYGDGTQTRSFCYVDDLIRGFLVLMDHPARPPGPINLGNPVELSVKELAETIRALVNSHSPLAYSSLPVDDPKQRRPDISLAKKFMNWEPKVPLFQGLRTTIAYYQQEAARSQKEVA